MDKIIDINSKKQYSIFSKKGKNLLKSYIRIFNNYQSGGVSPLNEKEQEIYDYILERYNQNSFQRQRDPLLDELNAI